MRHSPPRPPRWEPHATGACVVLALVAPLALLTATSSAAAKPPATMEDLSALAAQGANAELLERAEDVAPAARNETWRGLVAKAASAAVAAAPSSEDPFAPLAQAEALQARFAFLSQAAGFVEARDGAVVAALSRCVERPAYESQRCLTRLAPSERTLSPAGSLAFARALKRGGFVAYRPMAALARAIVKADADTCADPLVEPTVLAALDTPVDSEPAVAARTVAFERCFSALRTALKGSMVGASDTRLKNVCPGLRAKKALSAFQEELCQDVLGK